MTAADLYFTGKPCKRGHVSYRFKSTRNCIDCNKERGRVANLSSTQIEVKRAIARNKYWADPVAARERNKLASKWFQMNHPKRNLAWTRLYQARKQQRTPAWADLAAIKAFYEACPEGYEVDHIYPLNGKDVCGLHVLGNLQYLTQFENRSKGSKL